MRLGCVLRATTDKNDGATLTLAQAPSRRLRYPVFSHGPRLSAYWGLPSVFSLPTSFYALRAERYRRFHFDKSFPTEIRCSLFGVRHPGIGASAGSPVTVTLEQEGVQFSCLIFGLRGRQRLTMRVSLIFVSGGTFYRNVMHLCTARRFRYRIWRLSYRPLLLAGPGAPEGEGQMYINKSGPLFMRE
jgi:hypothetical protein